MKKLIRDGKVAVLFSPGFGAGWYSWHGIEELLYDPSIVEWLEQGDLEKIRAFVELKYPDEYFGGLDDLKVEWVPQGTQFQIHEYDGAESLMFAHEQHWFTA